MLSSTAHTQSVDVELRHLHNKAPDHKAKGHAARVNRCNSKVKALHQTLFALFEREHAALHFTVPLSSTHARWQNPQDHWSQEVPELGLLSGDCVRHRLIRLRKSALYPVTAAYCPAIIFRIRDACSQTATSVQSTRALGKGFKVSAKHTGW